MKGTRFEKYELGYGLYKAEATAKLNEAIQRTRKPLLRDTAKFQNASPELQHKMMKAAYQRKLRLLREIHNPDED
jgi:hypothetical protein